MMHKLIIWVRKTIHACMYHLKQMPYIDDMKTSLQKNVFASLVRNYKCSVSLHMINYIKGIKTKIVFKCCCYEKLLTKDV